MLNTKKLKKLNKKEKEQKENEIKEKKTKTKLAYQNFLKANNSMEFCNTNITDIQYDLLNNQQNNFNNSNNNSNDQEQNEQTTLPIQEESHSQIDELFINPNHKQLINEAQELIFTNNITLALTKVKLILSDLDNTQLENIVAYFNCIFLIVDAYIINKEYKKAIKLAEEIGAMLWGIIKKIN